MVNLPDQLPSNKVRCIEGSMMYKPLLLFLVLLLSFLLGLTCGCDDPVGGYHGNPLEDTESSLLEDVADMQLSEAGITDPYYHKPDEVVFADDVGVIGVEVEGARPPRTTAVGQDSGRLA
jgi:hypothetical protein